MIPARLVLEAIAITIVFTKGSIFKTVRESGPAIWRELAACPLCAGVWIGMAWHFIRVAPTTTPTLSSWWITWTVDALAIGALSGVGALLLALFVALLDRWS